MRRNKLLIWAAFAAGLAISAAANSQTLWNGSVYSPVAPASVCGAGAFDYTVACNSAEFFLLGP